MVQGRPVKSVVRDRLIEILFVIGKDTAYNLHKHYVSIFGKCSQRNIYYQLQKGKDLDLFQIEEIVDEKGNFSWGETARKVYFKLGKGAKPQINLEVRNYFEHKKK